MHLHTLIKRMKYIHKPLFLLFLYKMQQTNRLDFLFNASHTMFSSCPSLSRYYMNEFQETLGEYELKPTKQIERLACQSCGQISIAGLNTQVRVIQKNRKQKKKEKRKSRNLIEMTCLTCQRVKVYHGSHKNKILKKTTTTTAGMITTMTTDVQRPAAVENNNKKKKNKSKNNLKALLAKQQQSATSSSSSSLGDFLSGL